MDKKLFVANWKSNKTKDEAATFFEYLKDNIANYKLEFSEIIIAPPFTLLSYSKDFIDKNALPVKLAAQNISSFPPGAYTGEINAKQLKEFAEYVIIGHSERRKYMHESENDIENKVREASEAGFIVIQCVQDENSIIYKGANIIAYEPPTAIGSGNPDEPEHIGQVFNHIISDNPEVKLLYGGSVSPENIKQFLPIKSISGFLIGGASLEAESFLSLL